MKKNQKNKTFLRPPVVTVLGHVDHGKSTLLDFMRKTNIAEEEAGGITQCLSSYEISHKTKNSKEDRKITFMDTPGHEAFSSLRECGACVADIVILVVSAEDGVMPQTKEVIDILFKTKTPFVVAINKIDSPKANIEKTKSSLAENGVYLEDWQGDVPSVNISAKTGEGVPELLDMVLLVADMEELEGDPNKDAEGYVVESTADPKVGTTALLIIKNGTLKVGDFIVAGNAYSPVRQIKTQCGNTETKEASFSSPIHISGWNNQPPAGVSFYKVNSKKEAEQKIKDLFSSAEKVPKSFLCPEDSEKRVIPIIIKVDMNGSIKAIRHELKKIEDKNPDVLFSFMTAEPGQISEKDVQTARTDPETLILGFNTSIHSRAKRALESADVKPHIFTIIYELTEWVEDHIKKTREKKETDKEHGSLKILKNFSSSKKGFVLGGVVKTGTLSKNDRVKIIRNDEVIGQGRIKELQRQKNPTASVKEGQECGMMIISPINITEGDVLSAFTVVVE